MRFLTEEDSDAPHRKPRFLPRNQTSPAAFCFLPSNTRTHLDWKCPGQKNSTSALPSSLGRGSSKTNVFHEAKQLHKLLHCQQHSVRKTLSWCFQTGRVAQGRNQLTESTRESYISSLLLVINLDLKAVTSRKSNFQGIQCMSLYVPHYHLKDVN